MEKYNCKYINSDGDIITMSNSYTVEQMHAVEWNHTGNISYVSGDYDKGLHNIHLRDGSRYEFTKKE